MANEAVRDGIARKSLWAAVAFYVVIGFEFLYMASPFAAFFYSVYRPGLNFFNEVPLFSWLTRFFMPHIAAETSSVAINSHGTVGAFLAILGFAVFCIGAAQVYFNKLTKRGPVTGGAYRFIRHPQYAAFIVCGFGLLLLWPRYIVLLMFITMLFGYYWLARIEERECERRYGLPYRDYVDATSMFVPLPLSARKLSRFPASGWRRYAAFAVLYAVIMAGGITGARMLESHSLKSLYTYVTADSVTVSAVKMSPEVLKAVVTTALAHRDVQKLLEQQGPGTHYLNYVLPAQWFISEVPMDSPEGTCDSQPKVYDRHLYKIILTRADVRGPLHESAEMSLPQVVRREPLAEVWVDTAGNRVTQVKDLPSTARYGNIPVALY